MQADNLSLDESGRVSRSAAGVATSARLTSTFIISFFYIIIIIFFFFLFFFKKNKIKRK